MTTSYALILINLTELGSELHEIAKEDIPLTKLLTKITSHQLEQTIWLERAIRFGDTRLSSDQKKLGLLKAKKEFTKYANLVEEELRSAEALLEYNIQNAFTSEGKKEIKRKERNRQN